MGSEDFAYMLEEKPGAYIVIGQQDDGHMAYEHNQDFNFNDKVLATGASYWAALVEKTLPRNS